MDIKELCGWTENPQEVDRICQSLPVPIFDTPEPDNKLEFVHLNLIHDKYSNYKLGDCIQRIGDCVSYGNGKHLIDIRQAVQIHDRIANAANQFGIGTKAYDLIVAKAIYEYQEASSEAVYALSRVEYGNLDGSYSDGSVGAWMTKALENGGWISYRNLKELGYGDKYDPNRAKEWGAKGLPDKLEPDARKHNFETMSLVRNFKEAAWHIQNGRPVGVCSNIGFENNGGRTQRDQDGFAQPRGRWDHSMNFMAVRMGRRPGLGLLNQWPYSMVLGPKGHPNDPDRNFWWVDIDTVNRMLGQGDSWTGDHTKGYPARRLWRG